MSESEQDEVNGFALLVVGAAVIVFCAAATATAAAVAWRIWQAIA